MREINKLIWHKLATHNGGDFFNEILFGHPNLPALDSVMMSSAEQTVRDTRRACRKDRSQIVHSPIYPLLYPLNSFTEKDFFVVSILTHASGNQYDPASRIVPALLFQPHFPNRVYEKHNTEDGKRGIAEYHTSRVKVVKALRRVAFFVNRQGQPLQMMKPMKLDSALLEQPLYH